MMPKLPLVFAVLAISASTAPAANAPKPRDDVAATIMIMDGPRADNCKDRKIIKTDVIEAAPDKKPLVERWTLDRCGKTIAYSVKYSNAGKNFDVQLEK